MSKLTDLHKIETTIQPVNPDLLDEADYVARTYGGICGSCEMEVGQLVWNDGHYVCEDCFEPLEPDDVEG